MHAHGYLNTYISLALDYHILQKHISAKMCTSMYLFVSYIVHKFLQDVVLMKVS